MNAGKGIDENKQGARAQMQLGRLHHPLAPCYELAAWGATQTGATRQLSSARSKIATDTDSLLLTHDTRS